MADERRIPASRSTDLPGATIRSGGERITATIQVVSVVVVDAANRIPFARLTLKDGDPSAEDFAVSGSDTFVPGAEIEIAVGYHSDHETVFTGTVVKQAINVRGDRRSHLVVECRGAPYRMTLGRKSRYFADVTDAEAIEDVVGGHGIDVDVEATAVQHRELVQYRATDWDFVVSRAELNGRLVLARNGGMVVRKPDFSADPVLTLTYGATIMKIDAELDASHQHETLECAAWDPSTQERAQSEAQPPDVLEAGNLSSADLSKALGDAPLVFEHAGFLPADELQAWADAQRLKNVLSKIRGTVRCQGYAAVKPGTLVELAGVGDRFNGKVLVTGVRHELSGGGWDMDVQFGLEAGLFAAEYDVTDLPAAGLTPAVNGLQAGVVTQLQDDPDGEHRILVRMPVADPGAEGTWARVATLDAGESRGSFFLPEIGDEVVLGFVNDDPREPVVLGMLHSSGKPAPEPASDDNHRKGFVTREELTLVFDDERKSVRVETPGGNVVELSDDAGGVLLEDQNGNKLVLDSEGIRVESVGTLTLKASGDVTIEGVNVETKANANVKAAGSAGAEISSSGTTTVKGSLVRIN